MCNTWIWHVHFYGDIVSWLDCLDCTWMASVILFLFQALLEESLYARCSLRCCYILSCCYHISLVVFAAAASSSCYSCYSSFLCLSFAPNNVTVPSLYLLYLHTVVASRLLLLHVDYDQFVLLFSAACLHLLSILLLFFSSFIFFSFSSCLSSEIII